MQQQRTNILKLFSKFDVHIILETRRTNDWLQARCLPEWRSVFINIHLPVSEIIWSDMKQECRMRVCGGVMV